LINLQRLVGGVQKFRTISLLWAKFCLTTSCKLVSYSDDFSTLKMEVIRSSETSGLKRTTRCYVPENFNIHYYRCENLKSYKISIV
jgi:hypothetical protein